ncbi:MAG TPA: hypothetical protein VHE33_20595 [Acidobacteriaceae bacterium]|nr:hypothetical protein [Acidobacteriaceae bacterium]
MRDRRYRVGKQQDCQPTGRSRLSGVTLATPAKIANQASVATTATIAAAAIRQLSLMQGSPQLSGKPAQYAVL